MQRTLPTLLYTAEQTRMFDRLAIEEFGIPGYELMSRAGQYAFDIISERWPDARTIIIVCGVGNNGGDGYVVARLAHQAAYRVRVLQLGEIERQRDEAKQALADLKDAGLEVLPFDEKHLVGADLVVDAIFGTGLTREPSGIFRSAIDAINRSRAICVALDIPSGLNANSGAILGLSVKADATVAFVALKRGLFTGQARAICGELFFSDLQIPKAVLDRINAKSERVSLPSITTLLGARIKTSHKGDFGHVLLIGGNYGMSGAIRLAGEAALRCGAGLVSIATRSLHATLIAMQRPELMVHGVESELELDRLIKKATLIAIGPGLGDDEWSDMVYRVALASNIPLVVDADALNKLSRQPRQRDDWVLTPHPGEAARLLSCTTDNVENDRFAATKELQNRYGGIVVLKGAGSILSDGNERFRICDRGNPGMASGGMGDVLTGVIASLLAQGKKTNVDRFDLVSSAVDLHAASADEAAQQAGERGMIASDLIPFLRVGVNR